MKNNAKTNKSRRASYRDSIPDELADLLYEKILHKMVVEKKYRDSTYSAKTLAQELDTNARTISAVVNMRFNVNYPTLVNEYRVRESMHLLTDRRYVGKTVEQIAKMVGFSNRQSFYTSFMRFVGKTPNLYRRTHKREGNG